MVVPSYSCLIKSRILGSGMEPTNWLTGLPSLKATTIGTERTCMLNSEQNRRSGMVCVHIAHSPSIVGTRGESPVARELHTLNSCASSICWSMSTVTRSTFLPVAPVVRSASLVTFSRMGESILHGPHQLFQGKGDKKVSDVCLYLGMSEGG